MLLFTLHLLLTGCAPKAASAPATAAPADMHAPLPYTAAQIHDAMPVGTHIRLSVEIEGGPPVFHDWVVTDNTPEDVEIAYQLQDAAGQVLQPPERGRDTWDALRDHAAFPAAATARMEARLETSMGAYDCWLYQVESLGPDGQPQTERYWFARELPGPPVRWETSRGGEVVQRLTMVERTPIR